MTRYQGYSELLKAALDMADQIQEVLDHYQDWIDLDVKADLHHIRAAIIAKRTTLHKTINDVALSEKEKREDAEKKSIELEVACGRAKDLCRIIVARPRSVPPSDISPEDIIRLPRQPECWIIRDGNHEVKVGKKQYYLVLCDLENVPGKQWDH